MSAILEATVLAMLVLTGALLLASLGYRRPLAVAALGLPIGACLYALVGAVLLAAPLPAHPILGLGLALTVATGTAAWRRHQTGRSNATSWRWWMVIAGYWLAAAAAHEAAFVSVTPDSYRYLTTAGIVGTSGGVELGNAFLLESRGWTFPYLHALSLPLGNRYLVSLAPLLGAAGLLLLLWFAMELREYRSRSWWMVGGVVALIATTERYAYHSVYINAHMMFAVLAGVVSAGLVLSVRPSSDPEDRPFPMVIIAVAALTLIRPEAPLIAGLLIVPTLAADVGIRRKRLLLFAVAIPTIAWFAQAAAMYGQEGRDISTTALGMLGYGVVVLLCGVALGPIGSRMPAHVPAWLLLLLLMAVLGFGIRQPDLFLDSLVATARNATVDGLWGASLLLIIGLLLITFSKVDPFPGRSTFGFPLLAFLPTALLLAHLRGGAYRVGPGDSLNRMFLHMILVAALALIAGSSAAEAREDPSLR